LEQESYMLQHVCFVDTLSFHALTVLQGRTRDRSAEAEKKTTDAPHFGPAPLIFIFVTFGHLSQTLAGHMQLAILDQQVAPSLECKHISQALLRCNDSLDRIPSLTLRGHRRSKVNVDLEVLGMVSY